MKIISFGGLIGKSYFPAIEAWSLQNKGKAEFALSLYRQISAPGCSHYLTDTEILEALWGLSHVPVGVSLSPSVGTGQAASALGGCTVILRIWVNCSSPKLITQPNQSQFSFHRSTQLHSSRRPTPLPGFIACPELLWLCRAKNKVAITVC